MKSEQTIKVIFELNLKLDEKEAKALEAMISYGFDNFKNAFYDKLGSWYMQPYEDGLRSIFYSIDNQIRPQLAQLEKIKESCQHVLETNNGN